MLLKKNFALIGLSVVMVILSACGSDHVDDALDFEPEIAAFTVSSPNVNNSPYPIATDFQSGVFYVEWHVPDPELYWVEIWLSQDNSNHYNAADDIRFINETCGADSLSRCEERGKLRCEMSTDDSILCDFDGNSRADTKARSLSDWFASAELSSSNEGDYVPAYMVLEICDKILSDCSTEKVPVQVYPSN